MKLCSPALILLATLSLLAPATAQDDEVLPSGPAQERTIGPGEKHSFRVPASAAPRFVIVEQRGIDLVAEARGPVDREAMAVDSLNDRWGVEVVPLALQGGEARIEIRPGSPAVPPARYTIQVDEPGTGEEAAQRVAALMAMSRAEQFPSATLETRRQAVATYREALAAWRSLGEQRWQAETLYLIAALERRSGDLTSAVEEYARAAELWGELAEPKREAAVLRALGAARLQAGQIEAARAALERSISLWQALGERREEAGPRSDLCAWEQTSGSLRVALACYEENRALFRELGDGSQEARILNNLGGIYDLLGEPDEALEHYQLALDLRRSIGDREGEAETLSNIATVRLVLGEWQEALRILSAALEIAEPLGNPKQLALLFHNIGGSYLALGDLQRALPFLEDALKLRRQIGARQDEIITLRMLGSTWRRLGDMEQALDRHRQALELALQLKDLRQEALTRLHLAEVNLERGEHSAALREIDPSLSVLREQGLFQGELQALQLRGRALALAGQLGEALPVIQEVLARRQAVRDRAREPETLRLLATVERSLGHLAAARLHAEAAVTSLEELRTGFVSPDLRATFLATQRGAYSLLIDLLMERHDTDRSAGHDVRAFELSEQARARSLIDALYAGHARRPGGAVPAELTARRDSLRRRLSAKADQQLTQGGGRAEALGREIATIRAELDGLEADIRLHDPRYAAIRNAQSIPLEKAAGLLDAGTLLLEYSLGETRSFLWVVSARGLRSFELPPLRTIEDLVRRVYEEMRTVDSGAPGPSRSAEELSRMLFGTAWNELAGARRWVVVADGALHLLPFSALPVPGPGQDWDASGRWEPVLETIEVVHVSSATTLALQRQRLEHRSPAPRLAAVLADPVFSADDPRFSPPPAVGRQPAATDGVARGAAIRKVLPVFERLPGSRQEAEEIVSLASAGQVWTALDFAANREAVLSNEIRPYRVVHFATHGLADARNPELSGLVLSLVDKNGQPRQGFLGLSDVYELDLDADLVVLSGCQTALGKEVRGEGLMGLTRGFLYAGVPRVVASLWRVQDRATAKLMHRFYQAMWRPQGLSPAAALREAQRSLRQEARYRDPYFWAGFVLQGDWRSASDGSNPAR